VGPDNEPVAIKKELASKKVTRSVLEYEYHVYKALAGHETIPNVKVYGRHEHFNILVMDLLGPSLGDQFRDCDKRFSLRTTARLGLGMVSPLLLPSFERFLKIVLNAIEYIQSRGFFIYRDIKPEKFLLGRGATSHIMYAVDFGLARRWRHPTPSTLVTSPAAEEGVIGTLPFVSINAHLGQGTPPLNACMLIFNIRTNTPRRPPIPNIHPTPLRRVLEKKRS
jgi:serine/threonine protein kinase